MDLHVLEARINMDIANLRAELAAAQYATACGNIAEDLPPAPAKTEEAKPTAKDKQKAAGDKAKADQAKVQAAADAAEAKKPPFDADTKVEDVAAATGYKEGPINVFGNELIYLRHLSPEQRAPYMSGVELGNYNHTTCEKEGVMAPDLVAEAIAGLGVKAPDGEYTIAKFKEEGDAFKAKMKPVAEKIGQKLVVHMLGRTDRKTFTTNVSAIFKAMG